MKLSKLLIAIIVVVVIASIGAALTLMSHLTPTPPTPTPVVMRISYQPSWHHAAFFVMVEKGWLEKVFGDRVKIVMRQIPTGPDQMNALVAGEL
ncbi:MAG: hypothetical protein QXS32_06225, partial [Candidatus Nezhaarchaeales archaeon]